MKSHGYTSLLGILFLSLFSCDVEETPAKQLGPFNKISSNGPVTFTFVQGAENKVLTTSMMDNYYSVSNGQLNINGMGSMTIAIKNLYLLWCNSCSVENNGPLVVDTLNFYMHGGSMKFSDIHVNNILQINAINTGTYKLSGTAAFVNLSTINLVSYEAYNLITDSTYINTTSILDAELHTTHVVNAFINSMGSVNFKGNPPIVRASISGQGKMVRK